MLTESDATQQSGASFLLGQGVIMIHSGAAAWSTGTPGKIQ